MSVEAAQRPGDPLWDPAWVPAEGEATIKARTATQGAPITLYTSWFCPYAQRAWIALEEKQVPYRYVEINPYEVDPSQQGGYTKKQLPLTEKRRKYPGFVETSPRGLVPAIDHDGKKVWESLHVVQYIDEAFPQHGDALVPRNDPLQRAQVRIWTDHCGDRIQKAFYTMLLAQQPERQVEAKEHFFDECRALASAMSTSGPYFLGDKFCMVDVALAPFWQRFEWVGSHYRGLKLPDSDPAFVRLYSWWQAVRQRPCVAATIVCQPRLIASYAQYSRNEATSDYSKNMQSALSGTAAEATKMNRSLALNFFCPLVSGAVGALIGTMLLQRRASQ